MDTYLHQWALENQKRSEEVPAIRELLTWFYSQPVSTWTDWLTDQIEPYARVQSYKAAIKQSIDLINNGGDPNQIPDVFNKVQMRAAMRQRIKMPVDLTDPESLRNRVFSVEPRHTVSSPWDKLNSYTGGPAKQELFTIAAPSNVGKTWALCNMGIGAFQAGAMVLHISLEMSEVLTAHRYLSGLFRWSTSQVVQYQDALLQHLPQLEASYGGKILAIDYPTGQLRISDLRQMLLFMHSLYGKFPDMVVIDYLDLMATEATHRDRQQRHRELSELYTAFRGMAVEFNFAAVTVSQVKQAAVNREIIRISDLAECWDKASISDIVIALCQTEEEEPRYTDQGQLIKEGEARFFVAKNRNMSRGQVIKLRLDYQHGRIDEETGSMPQINMPQNVLNPYANPYGTNTFTTPTFNPNQSPNQPTQYGA
jgi:hypothetical protein